MSVIDLISKASQAGLIPASSRNLEKPRVPSSLDFDSELIYCTVESRGRIRGKETVDRENSSAEPAQETEDERSLTLAAGLEFYAWYTPFHFNLDHWGVYIRARGIELLGNKLFHAGVPWQDAFDQAYSLLLAHELRHMEVEMKVTEFELMEDRHIYVPSNRLIRESAPWFDEEEALCNLAMIDSAKGVVKRAIEQITTVPYLPGYSDWRKLAMCSQTEAWGLAVGILIRRRATLVIPAHKSLGAAALRRNPPKIVLDGSLPDGRVAGPFKLIY